GNLTAAQRYVTTPCDLGVFRLMPPSADVVPSDFLCPNGKATLFGKCFQPVRLVGTTPDAACLAPDFPVQGFQTNGIVHGGVYNLIAKNSSGNYLGDANGRPITGAFYRLHSTKLEPTGAAPCTKPASPEQIRCLAAASPCSIGITG